MKGARPMMYEFEVYASGGAQRDIVIERRRREFDRVDAAMEYAGNLSDEYPDLTCAVHEKRGSLAWAHVGSVVLFKAKKQQDGAAG